MLKLDSTVHRLDSDIVSKSCQRGRCKGGFWRASEEKRRLSGFRSRRPPKQSWQVLLQQLSLGPNFLCTGASAASCGINTLAERTRCPPLSSNKKSNPGRILKGTQGVWSRSGVNSLYCCRDMTPNSSWLFVFTVSLRLCSVSQTLTLLPFAQHASYHVTGIYHFTSCEGGVVRQRGAASSSDAALHSQLSQTGSPPKVWWVSVLSRPIWNGNSVLLHGFLLLRTLFPQLSPA